MQHFMCTCAGLGSRRSGVGHKLHAVYHQLFMLTGRPPLLKDLCECIAAFTVDLGVEASMNKALPIPFDNMFPYFVVNDESLPDGYWQQEISLKHCLVVGGGMHMTSNMMKGMLSAMVTWNECIGAQATAISSFLHHPWTRERFIVTCLVDDLARFEFLFNSFPSDLTRWA